jgi:hypothetical protein
MVVQTRTDLVSDRYLRLDIFIYLRSIPQRGLNRAVRNQEKRFAKERKEGAPPALNLSPDGT